MRKNVKKELQEYLTKKFETNKVRFVSLSIPSLLYRKENESVDLTELIRKNDNLNFGVLSNYIRRFPRELQVVEISVFGFPTRAVLVPCGKVERIYVSVAYLYYLVTGRGLKTMPNELINLYAEIEKPGLAVFLPTLSYYLEVHSIRVSFGDGRYINFANPFSAVFYNDIDIKVRDAVSFEFILNLVEFLRTNQTVYPFVVSVFNSPFDIEDLAKDSESKSTTTRCRDSYYTSFPEIKGFFAVNTSDESLFEVVNDVYKKRFKIFPHQGSDTVQAVENYITMLKLVGIRE